MQCPVCFDDITSASGKAELSCTHTFHIKCLTSWFSKKDTCPCCRHEANDTEKMHKEDSANESKSESEWESESDYEDRPYYQRLTFEELSQKAAEERARHLFQKLKFLNPAYEVELYSVKSIQKFYRAYRLRKEYSEIREISKEKKEISKHLFNLQEELDLLSDAHKAKQKAFSEKYITSYTPQQTMQTQPQEL